MANHPEAFADHAAEFWLVAGADPDKALRLAKMNAGDSQHAARPRPAGAGRCCKRPWSTGCGREPNNWSAITIEVVKMFGFHRA